MHTIFGQWYNGLVAVFIAEFYAKMFEMKSRNRLAYCSGWTVEISAPACNREREKRKKRSSTSSVHNVPTWAQTSFWKADSTSPPISFLSNATHPVLDSFRCVSGFLLGVVLCEYINQTHEIDLPLRGSWNEKQKEILSYFTGSVL